MTRAAASGLAGSAASAAVAMACSRLENAHAARPPNAVTHIYDGGAPRAADGRGGRNTALGLAIHTGASIWWALFYEQLFGARARRSAAHALGGAGAIAAAAYVVDYFIVARRFRPGFEAFLSPRSMFAVYAALAVGFAAASLSSRERRAARRSPAGSA